MRILLLLGTSTGGVGRHVQDLCALLVGAGHRVAVACPAEVADSFDLAAHATVIPVAVTDRPHPLRDASAVAAIGRLMESADVTHAHGLRVGALAALARRRSGVPLVTTLHNCAPSGAVSGAVYTVLERIVARRSDLVLGVSADLVDRARRLGARRTGLAVVPAAPRRAAERDRYAVRAALEVQARTRLGVVLARLAPQKGLEVLLDAHAGLGDLDLVTVVAGEGPLRAGLQRRIEAEGLPVRLLGHRDDVPDLLAAADVVISSALWEGQPVGLQEALHAGAAIVATDAGGTRAVVGEAAILVPTEDPVALAGAIREVLTHGGIRDDLRSKAVEQADRLPTGAEALAAAQAAYDAVAAVR